MWLEVHHTVDGSVEGLLRAPHRTPHPQELRHISERLLEIGQEAAPLVGESRLSTN